MVLLLVAATVFQSCSSPQDFGGACTAEFVTISLTVLSPQGQPADSVDITVTNKENGDTYNICGEYSCRGGTDGTYTIMHDGFHEELSATREAVIVEGTKDQLGFEQEFAFRGGRCHVEKLAGPDTVSLSRN